jgi:predicted unusual protein kinase regulating ubiquinone biosynthesis (AarF/ABC1/UbiB family)
MVPMALDYHTAKWLYMPAPAAVRRARFEALHEKHKQRPLRLIMSLGGFYVKLGQVSPPLTRKPLSL